MSKMQGTLKVTLCVKDMLFVNNIPKNEHLLIVENKRKIPVKVKVECFTMNESKESCHSL